MEKVDKEDSVTKTITVPYDKVGHIIGKKGARIKSIQEETNTRIYQTQPCGTMFSIRGILSDVNDAHRCIVDIIEDAKQKEKEVRKIITIKRCMLGKIIGKEGSNIQRIEKETNTRISQPFRSLPELTISGEPSNVEAACEWIMTIMSDNATKSGYHDRGKRRGK